MLVNTTVAIPIFLVCTVQIVFASTIFIEPPIAGPLDAYGDNNVWTLGSLRTVMWETNYTIYSVYLFQQLIEDENRTRCIETVYSELMRMSRQTRPV